MISENETINNINWAFENSTNLEYIKIKGFIIDDLKSLNVLLLNTTKLSKIDLSEFSASSIGDFFICLLNLI